MIRKVQTQRKLPEIKLRGSLDHLEYPALVEPKFDGEFNWLIKDDSGIYTINPNGLRREGYNIRPELFEQKSVQLIGELFVLDGKKDSLYKMLDDPYFEEYAPKMYTIDIVELNGKILIDKPLRERRLALNKLFSSGYNKNYPKPKLALIKGEVEEYFKNMIGKGYEGIVARNMEERLILGDNNWVKVKHKDRSVFLVSHIDSERERIEVRVKSPYGVKDVGVKVTGDRKLLHIGDLVTIEHQGILETGGLRHPVYKGKGENA